MTDFDTQWTEYIVCPWCGYKHKEPESYSEGQHECNSCGKPFEMWRNIEVTYSTAVVLP